MASKSQKIVAVGNAVATKDDMNIKADRLIGYYAGRQNTAKGKSKITKVEARGNVAMHSPKADAFGSAMDYDLVQDVVILRGEPAKIKTDTETISAEDNITYYPSQQKAVAFGNVIAVDKDSNRILPTKWSHISSKAETMTIHQASPLTKLKSPAMSK